MVVGPLAAEASASHFRFGNLNWQEASSGPGGTDVNFRYEESWRRSAFTGSGSDGFPVAGDVLGEFELSCIDFADGNDACPAYKVTFANVAEDYFIAHALAPGSSTDRNVPHTYADPGPFTVTGANSCCTISTLLNAADADFNIFARVDPVNEDESAKSSLPPIVHLPEGGVQNFTVPATDPGGETLRFRVTDADESCLGCADPHPPGLSIDPGTGQVSWDTTGREGLWWTGVVVESLVSDAVVASTQIDYIIRVGGGSGNQSPIWDAGMTPADGSVFEVSPGSTLSFPLQVVDPDGGDVVSIQQSSGPGALTPNDGNPATATFSFTPASAEVGTEHIVQFLATDTGSPPLGPPFRSYIVKVVDSGAAPPLPEPPLPPPPPPGQQPPPAFPAQEPVLDPPVVAKDVNVEPVSGEVFVRLPRGASARARPDGSARHAAQMRKGFIPLSQAAKIPVGSLLDTRRGTVGMTAASDLTGGTQKGNFNGGIFKVQQKRRARPVTQLKLAGGTLKRCTRNLARRSAAETARRRRIRRLRGNARGRFRTRGRYGSATVRGTEWTMKDGCKGTLTRVKSGVVRVRDFSKRRTVTLRSGDRYLARPRARRR